MHILARNKMIITQYSAHKMAVTVIPVWGGVVALLLIFLAQLCFHFALLFLQVPTKGRQLSDHFLVTILSKQSKERDKGGSSNVVI